ncbi:hypothetical protein IGS73_14810 [Janibacter indicus]|uniref:Uncharacterized protein n=1 Tax=Janibacter indicus TaxID=857417 RepID=A0A7L9J105_9MICO|nr:hypothetical protein [Janibacter indicus]QOK22340.1 hypothetical protein IGS73_14810 [Janibacter indicus]
MTPFDQAVARSYGSDMRCIVAGCDLDRIKRQMRGASHYVVRGQSYWMSTTARGIEVRERLDQAGHLVRWGDITSHVRALPQRVIDAAREVDRDAHRPPASGLEWHDFRAPEPRTDAQLLAHRLWHESVVQRTADVLRRAFPEADHEDLDLFAATGSEGLR